MLRKIRFFLVQKADPTKQGLKRIANFTFFRHFTRPKGRSNKTRIETSETSGGIGAGEPSKRQIQQNKDWNKLSSPIPQAKGLVQKADPTKQGLKPYSINGIVWFHSKVQKADPTKQGLKPPSEVYLVNAIFSPKGRSNKTRIETLCLWDRSLSLLIRPKGRSNKTRIETRTMQLYTLWNWWSKRQIQQNKDWNMQLTKSEKKLYSDVQKADPTKQGLKLMIIAYFDWFFNVSKRQIQQNKDWNLRCAIHDDGTRHVQKADPTKQGLKLLTIRCHFCIFLVQKADPTKQGLKPGWHTRMVMRVYRPKGRSNKTRIETGWICPSGAETIRRPKGRSNKTRIETNDIDAYVPNMYTSKRQIQQNKDWN